MLRLILIAITLLLVLVGGLAVALSHFYGWKGLVAFPFILLLLVWLGKVVIGKLLKGFFLRLFSMKSGALRGASVAVHSITPVSEPAHASDKSIEDKDEGTDDSEEDVDEDGDAEKAEEAPEEGESEPKEPRHYYAVDLTITPLEKNLQRFWEPGELILTSERLKSLEDLESGEKEVGTTHDVEVWNGSSFGPDDECKYPGARRLRVTFAVKPGASKAWLHYYAETLGSLEFPAWAPAPVA
jgi:hypothetical protein